MSTIQGTTVLSPRQQKGVRIAERHQLCPKSDVRDAFLPHYHRRSNAESTLSMIEATLGDALHPDGWPVAVLGGGSPVPGREEVDHE
jgi:hypothetical protein